ncbi:cytochrome b5 domain-containing protein 1 [Culicoides brevitarsis]|uniref:cytochrome b5 domain-containing protein 1 n=1 Tax=Culicoides brevitarsis TaxID=469753 RepID=UPI00307B2C18
MKYFLRDEVLMHNKPKDFWVIFFNDVLDLTLFFKTREDSMTHSLKFLQQYGGQDISHFFNPDKTPYTRISVTGSHVPVFPVVNECSGSDVFGNRNLTWWQDPFWKIGELTKQPRKVRIVNTLSVSTQEMTVCEEDTLDIIRTKYQKYNWNHDKYQWCKYDADKDVYEDICFRKTLTENGFHCHEYGEPHTPSLWLFFKDEAQFAGILSHLSKRTYACENKIVT